MLVKDIIPLLNGFRVITKDTNGKKMVLENVTEWKVVRIEHVSERLIQFVVE